MRFRFNISQVLPNVQDHNDVAAQLEDIEMAHALLDRIVPGCDMDTATGLRQVARETYESVIGAPVSMPLTEAQQLQMYQRLRALRERLNLPQIEPPTPELE